jgi:hypothetical protein
MLTQRERVTYHPTEVKNETRRLDRERPKSRWTCERQHPWGTPQSETANQRKQENMDIPVGDAPLGGDEKREKGGSHGEYEDDDDKLVDDGHLGTNPSKTGSENIGNNEEDEPEMPRETPQEPLPLSSLSKKIKNRKSTQERLGRLLDNDVITTEQERQGHRGTLPTPSVLQQFQHKQCTNFIV